MGNLRIDPLATRLERFSVSGGRLVQGHFDDRLNTRFFYRDVLSGGELELASISLCRVGKFLGLGTGVVRPDCADLSIGKVVSTGGEGAHVVKSDDAAVFISADRVCQTPRKFGRLDSSIVAIFGGNLF